MIKVIVKEGESIERAVKRYRRKHRNVQILKQIKDRKAYKKPSTERREQVEKARYKQQYLLDQER